MSSWSDDSDDLDADPKFRKKKFQRPSLKPSSSEISSSDIDPFHDDERAKKKAKREPPTSDVAIKEEWIDSDGEDVGTAAAKIFKERASKARKHATKQTKRAKALDAENNPRPEKSDGGTTGVGKRKPRKFKKDRISKDDSLSSDEAGMDHTMPDYVQGRRARFDERAERLKEAGLALPPSYDEVYFSDDDRMRELKERPDLPNITPPSDYKDIELPYSLGIIPAPIAQYLRRYQVDGAAFLHELYAYQKGGILGDDMGLGKTIQVIAFLSAAFGKTGDERDAKRMRKMRRNGLTYPRILIICPGSLMANWQDELNRWGWWHSQLYHGERREDVLAQAKSGLIEIMITTYTTYRTSKEQINTVQWDCVIADECHMIKQRKSATTKAMNEVNALCRIGLTGTAIQNKYEELWTLLNWTSPGRFGPVSQWRVTISDPLKLGQSHEATSYELARARKTATQLVQNLLPQFFLRRMKTLIKNQLPKKTDRVVFCPLTPAQADAYRNFLESDYVQTIKNSTEYCECGSKKKRGWCCGVVLENGEKWQEWVFPCIAYLQRLSNHLALLIPSGNDEKKKQAKDLEMLQSAVPDEWQELAATKDSIMNYSNPDFCGKWRVLRKLLKFWHGQGGNKVLVFSHSVKLLKMLQNLFIHTNYDVKYLDGSMSYEDRYAAVKDFNADPSQFVFLISTRAGGVGLNITSANKVVVVDPNWNPSYDLQAQDRAYRIGQTRDVEVFRLVSQGTLEEIVYARQIYKQQMSNIGLSGTSERRYFTGIQDRPSQKGEIFGLKNLFAYQDENVVLKDIVHKTNVAEARADLQIAELDLENEDIEDPSDQEEGIEQKSTSQPREQEHADAAMSQLVAEIIGETGKKTRTSGASFNSATSDKRHDPVQAILASAGVSYTHENSEVIGSSRVEDALSKRAAEATDTQRESRVFAKESQSQGRGDIGDLGVYLDNDEIREFKYRYRPPEDVARRQFCSMAKWAGYGGTQEGVVEFALVVEGWTQARRRDFLEAWYKYRREYLIGKARGVYIGYGGEGFGVNGGVKDEFEDNMDLDVKVKVEDSSVKKAGTKVKKEDQIVISKVDEVMIIDSDDDEL